MGRLKVLNMVGVVLLLGGAVAASVDEQPMIYASGVAVQLVGGGTGSEVAQIGVIDPVTDTSQVLFVDDFYFFEDVVVGPGPATEDVSVPPQYVYACAPDGGLIIRFDPALVGQVPLSLEDDEVEIVFNSDATGQTIKPQCGWFTAKGDLIFTDTTGNGAWICEGIGFEQDPVASGDLGDPLCQIGEETPDNLKTLGDGSGLSLFAGQGITQAANGDALAVDNDPDFGRILRFEIDGPTGTFPGEPPVALNLVDDGELVALKDAFGIARLSTGDIFVSGGILAEDKMSGAGGVLRLVGQPDDDGGKDWVLACPPIVFDSEGCGSEEVYFLEAAADDTVYVGTTSDQCGGAVWKLTVEDGEGFGCSEPELVFPVDGGQYGWLPDAIIGLGVSRTATPPSSFGSPPEYFFNFSDHVYELTLPEGAECTVEEESVLAEEVPKSCLEAILATNVYYDFDGAEPASPVNGFPVLYLGDKANGQVYNIDGSCEGTQGDIFHAVSAYTEDLTNPRLIRCDVADICDVAEEDICTILDLFSFFPGEGVLPDDGRIGSRQAVASFSQYFVVDAGDGGYDPDNTVPADFCGFRRPLNNATRPDDPRMSVFREGRTIPFKFKVATEDGSCRRGPYAAPEGILLSIARVEPDFDAKEVVCVGGGCGEVPYFDPPNNPKKGFHMNVRTDGFEPGIYIATLVATGGEFAPVSIYFEIVP